MFSLHDIGQVFCSAVLSSQFVSSSLLSFNHKNAVLQGQNETVLITALVADGMASRYSPLCIIVKRPQLRL